MSEDQIKKMKIENLIYRLNVKAQERKAALDKLWQLESETEAMRLELMQLIDHGTTN